MEFSFARVEHDIPAVDLLRTEYVQGEVPVQSKLQGVLDFVALASASPYGQRVAPEKVVYKPDAATIAKRNVDRILLKMEAASDARMGTLLRARGRKAQAERLKKLRLGGGFSTNAVAEGGSAAGSLTQGVMRNWAEDAALSASGKYRAQAKLTTPVPACPAKGTLFDLRMSSEFMRNGERGAEGVAETRRRQSGGDSSKFPATLPVMPAYGSSKTLPGGGSDVMKARLTSRPRPPGEGGMVEPNCYAVPRQANPTQLPTSLRTFAEKDQRAAQAQNRRPKVVHVEVGMAPSSFELRDETAAAATDHTPSAALSLAYRPSAEMQAAVDAHIDQQLGSGYWDDEVSSSLARPLDATAYCSRSLQLAHDAASTSLASSVAAMGVGALPQETPAAHRAALFNYSNEAHEMAARLQRAWRRRRTAKERAARWLQRVYRGAALRADLRDLRARRLAAVVVVQSMMRGKLGRLEARRLANVERSRQLLKVQRLWRGARGRQRCMRLAHARHALAAARVQGLWRAVGAWRYVQNLLLERATDATVKLQALARGYVQRLHGFEAALRRVSAATLVQRAFRYYLFRVKQFSARLIQRLFRLNAVMRAAKRIQVNFRGTRGRFWARCEKRRRVVRERARRGREVAMLQGATDDAIARLEAKWKTKAGKKDLKAAKKKIKAANVAAKRAAKKLSSSNPKERRLVPLRAAWSRFDVLESGALPYEDMLALFRELGVPLRLTATAEEVRAAANERGTPLLDDTELAARVGRHIDEAAAAAGASGKGRPPAGEVEFDAFAAWFLGGGAAPAPGRRCACTSRLKARSGRSLRRLCGKPLEAQARRLLIAKKEAEVYKNLLPAFRKRAPPPFVRTCTRAFTFPWEMIEFEKHERGRLKDAEAAAAAAEDEEQQAEPEPGAGKDEGKGKAGKDKKSKSKKKHSDKGKKAMAKGRHDIKTVSELKRWYAADGVGYLPQGGSE